MPLIEMQRIIFLICFIVNFDAFFAYEFGDRIQTSKNFVESEERIRKSQPTFHASSNVPERIIDEIVLDGGLFELLDEGKNLSDTPEFDENKDAVVQFYPINEFIDVTTDVTTEVHVNRETEITDQSDVPKDKDDDEVIVSEDDDDMLPASSDNLLQIVENKEKIHWKREDNRKRKEDKKEHLNEKKVVTSYVHFGPKLSALKPPKYSTSQIPAATKAKYTFRRINDNKDTTERINEESEGRKDANSINKEQVNAEVRSKGDRNQSVTKDNKQTKRIHDKVKYVEVRRDKGTTKDDNAEIKSLSGNDAFHLTASNSDDAPIIATTEPPATTFASFHYFTKNNKSHYAQNPDIRLTVRKPETSSFNKGIANIRISEISRNTFYLLNGSQSAQLPNHISEKKVVLNPSKASNSHNDINLMPEHQQILSLSPNTVNISKHSQSPLQYFSAPPTPKSAMESNEAITDEDNTRVYKDILDSTKSIIQKANLQFHKQDTISVPHKYLQPPKFTENFDTQSDFPNFGSSSTISKTMVPPPIKTMLATSSNAFPTFSLSPSSPSSGNLYREDLTGSDSTSEKVWPLWRQQIERDEEPVSESTKEVKYTVVEGNVSNRPENNNYGQFSEDNLLFKQGPKSPTAVAFATSELHGSSKSTEFLYDRPNNFHTSFEDYLETHGIYGPKFNKGIPDKSLNNNKVEHRENYNNQYFGDSRPETQKALGTYPKAESELRNLVPIPTFKTADKSHQGEDNGYYNTLFKGNISLNNIKNSLNLKEKQLPSNSKTSQSNIAADSKKAVNFPNSISLSANNQISSYINSEGSVRQVQQQQEFIPPNSAATSQSLHQPSIPVSSQVNQSSKFKVNPPVLNTIQKRPQSFRPRPSNRPHFPPPRPSFNPILRPQTRGKERRPPLHPRLALSKYLQPPPPLNLEEENEFDNSVAQETQIANLNIQPGNLTAYYKSNPQIPALSSVYAPTGSSSNHAPLVFNYNPFSRVPNSRQTPHLSGSKHLTNFYLPNQFQFEYQVPANSNSLQFQPHFKVKDLLPEGKLRAPYVDNNIAQSINYQDNPSSTSFKSNYSPSIASHVRGNTPSYQNEFKYTSPSVPSPGQPLRPPFQPTKAPPYQQLHKMASKRHKPKLFLGYKPLSFASSNINPIKYRPPHVFPPMFGRATHFHESNEIVYPVKEKQSSHFKVIRANDEEVATGLAGKSNSNAPTYQQLPQIWPQQNQNTVKPLNVFDNLIMSESVSIPIEVQPSSKPTKQNENKDTSSNQKGSQPLPKEIMKKRDHKVPESHLSMLRSLKYGIHGEPLDVWIPIKSNEEK